MREISKWVKRLTLKGYKSELAGAGDVLMINSSRQFNCRQCDFRFFRAPRGRFHPQFGRFVNVDLIFEGERRLLVEIEIFTEVVVLVEGRGGGGGHGIEDVRMSSEGEERVCVGGRSVRHCSHLALS